MNTTMGRSSEGSVSFRAAKLRYFWEQEAMPMPAEAQGGRVLLKYHILCLNSMTTVSIGAGLQQCERGASEAVCMRSQSQGLNRRGGDAAGILLKRQVKKNGEK